MLTRSRYGCFMPEKEKITSLFSKNIKGDLRNLKLSIVADLIFRKSCMSPTRL